MVQTPENCAGSAVAARLNVVDAPVVQVLRGDAGAVPAVMDVPVIMQRRWFATVQFLTFSSSPDLVDIPVRNRDRHAFRELRAMKCFFGAFCAMFSDSPVRRAWIFSSPR